MPDVERITIGNTVFEGENNAYLFGSDGDDPVLVDTAIAFTHIRDEFVDKLGDCGVDVADVDEILLTHHHEDHAGLAGEIQAESGATVRAHHSEAALTAREPEALAEMATLRRRRFADWNVPVPAYEELEADLTSFDEVEQAVAPDVEPYDEGDRFQAGGVTLEALHLPGHTAGQCGFIMERDGRTELLAGDALLPHYTPNVGGADLRLDRPLDHYLSTLRTIIDLDFDRVWPGHRDPIDDPSGRARELIDHHRERSRRILDFLADSGPVDVWSVSDHLFGTLEDIHILHGPGEAFAHLDHLHAHGVVERIPPTGDTLRSDADDEYDPTGHATGYDYDDRGVDLDELIPSPG